jgi:pyruvate,water dikinase
MMGQAGAARRTREPRSPAAGDGAGIDSAQREERRFAQLFDGFSIGSNDLTQLTVGADRDSELLAPLFDERDVGVLRLIEMVLDRAHRPGRRVGVCGQAPSDHPELAAFLAKIGIDSISLVPDALPRVARHLAAV